ncbi:membrane-spanning 4-domains subfamily A member 15-like, partial [Gopherus flavomarginatus]|uniref:membrane-spanning 4-domains subfamily A member 15-like n=1 Tax=Gopherus flavomarginatus TaxID=286002 RepID=UPI0021CBF9F5
LLLSLPYFLRIRYSWEACKQAGAGERQPGNAIFSAIGIVLLLTELIINASYSYFGLAAAKGIAVLLLLFTILEFSIAVSTLYFACLATCYTPNTAMLFRPYFANANLGVPSAQMASPEPPTNVD